MKSGRAFSFLLGVMVAGLALPALVRTANAQETKASRPEYLFVQANQFYAEGKYEEATARYELILGQGWESGSLYYNLGNCYFKRGELGKAIVNYERARRLLPRDGDLRSNYDYALSLIKSNLPGTRRNWLLSLIDRFSRQFAIDELSVLLSLAYVGAIAFLIASLFLPGVRRYLVPILVFLAVISVVSAISLGRRVSLLGKEAVVVREEVESKFEPRPEATTYFTLAEGMRVTVLEPGENWYKIKRADGKTAWVEKESLEII